MSMARADVLNALLGTTASESGQDAPNAFMLLFLWLGPSLRKTFMEHLWDLSDCKQSKTDRAPSLEEVHRSNMASLTS